MTRFADRYRTNAARFAALVDGVPDDRWSSPSPCDEWTAREVVQHVVDTQGMFIGLAGGEPAPVPDAETDPAAAFAAASANVQAWLDDPERADTEFDGYFGRTTFAAAVDRFLSSDLVVHGWDLARATGQDDSIDPAEAEATLAGARDFGDAFRGPGVCGPAVEVPADADAGARLVAFYGRTP